MRTPDSVILKADRLVKNYPIDPGNFRLLSAISRRSMVTILNSTRVIRQESSASPDPASRPLRGSDAIGGTNLRRAHLRGCR